MIENKNRTAAEDASIAVAEASRETDWKSKSFMGSLFMGDLDIRMVYPFPEQAPVDRAIGDDLCERVDAWARECLDGDQIDRDELIPAHVWRGLQELRLFAMKVPHVHGGLGLSQTNYMRVLALVAGYCGSTAATLSAHQSIGVPQPLKLFGTPAQKAAFLPRFAAGAVSAFALTEPEVGSDPAAMATTATPSEDGTHWVLNGEKLWCTNGVVADLLVVMARTPDRVVDGKPRRQISAFIVESNTPGVEVVHRCRFMGLRAIENGLIRLTDVKVPKENLVLAEGKGLKLALATLNDGRLGIPAVAAACVRDLAAFMTRWAKSRRQWGRAVGAHEAGSEKLAQINAGAYAMSALSDYCAALSDRGDVDLRIEAATAKMFNSELGWDLVDTALQLRGGRGYETESSLKARGEPSFPLERMLRDFRINRIVEGTTDVMRLFLAREALDPHLRKAGALFGRAGLGTKLATLAKAASFYGGWYPKLWLGMFRNRHQYDAFDDELARQLRWANRQTRKLARTLFHQMVWHGPKLEMRQNTLARVVDIGAELAVMTLVAARAQSELDRGESTHIHTAMFWLEEARLRVGRLHHALAHNTDVHATALATQLMESAEALPQTSSAHLHPLARERGVDLTSGDLVCRHGETTPPAS